MSVFGLEDDGSPSHYGVALQISLKAIGGNKLSGLAQSVEP